LIVGREERRDGPCIVSVHRRDQLLDDVCHDSIPSLGLARDARVVDPAPEPVVPRPP
jgi:hypothetical protein